MTWDSITYIMAALDEIRRRQAEAREQQVRSDDAIQRIEQRLGLVEASLVRFLQALRYAPSLLALILAGLAALRPDQAAGVIMALVAAIK